MKSGARQELILKLRKISNLCCRRISTLSRVRRVPEFHDIEHAGRLLVLDFQCINIRLSSRQ